MSHRPAIAQPSQEATTGTGRQALDSAAEVLDREADRIVAHWVSRLQTVLYRGRSDLGLEELVDHAPALVRSIAEAMRLRECQLPTGRWTGAAEQHAALRLEQRVALGDLIREYQLLRQEAWLVLRPHLEESAPADILDVTEDLDCALDTMAASATSTYGGELQQIVRHLEPLEARLEAVLRHLPAGVLIAAAPTGQVILVNEQAARIWRRPLPLATSVERYGEYPRYHPDGQPYAPAELPLARSIRSGEIVTGEEIEIKRGDGTRGTINVNSAPIRDREGKIVAAVTVFVDATERKQTEAERERLLGETERRAAELDAVITAVPVGLAVFDREGHITRINAATERLLAMGLDELRTPYAELTPPLPLETPEGRFLLPGEIPAARALRGEVVINEVLVVHRPDGATRWVTNNAAPVRGEGTGPSGAVLALTDITPLHDLQAQTERLLAAERDARARADAAVRARDDFLAASAHELKTPITNLRGFAETTLRRLAREQAPDREWVRRALQTVDRQSDRLARLVQQLLDVAGLEAGQLRLQPQETDLARVVRDVVDTEQAGTRRHNLQLRAPDTLAATVDPVRIGQVVANLLDNAIKFSPPGTPVDVELGTPTPGTIELSVRDYGPGIPPEARPLLFHRFYQAQTARPFAGMGLGLYYSRQIVDLHGGHIRAEFPPEGGTRMVVTLPRVQ